MDIRKLQEEELKMAADMTRQLFEDEASNKKLSAEAFEERLHNYLQTGCEAFLFCEDDRVVGYALVNLARTPYYLIDFFIARDARRGGKGTSAFNALLHKLETETMDLDVFCWNDRGRAFWKSLGFEEMAVIMRKQSDR